MFKYILFAGVLVSSAVLAQQADISGKDFLSGAGDAKLAQIASQAAAAGKKLVVTAPPYWQSKIAAKLHAGAANVNVQMSDGFFENVLVRIEDGKPAAAKADAAAAEADKTKAETARANAAKAEAARAEAAQAARAEAETAKADAARAAAAQAEAVKADAAKAKLEQAEAAKAEAARVAAAKLAAEKAEAAKAEAEKAAAAKAATDIIAASKQRMQQNLNDGNPADGDLSVAQLKTGDTLFVDGTVRGVVRRDGARTHLYWLQGDLNLERAELTPTGTDRYSVNQAVRDMPNPPLRTRTGGHFVGNVPAPGSAERTSLQEHYADGREISAVLSPADLRSGDIIYTGTGAAVVIRRTSAGLARYWLNGDLDLGQTGLMKQGGNVYRALSDTIK